MNTRLLKWIPQSFDEPESAERLIYKAKAGSYKAPEILLSLLEFTCVAIIGGHAWDELEEAAMAEGLFSRYRALKGADISENPCAFAVRWAWPPMEGSVVVFEKDELLQGVEALCFLLANEPPGGVVQRLIAYHCRSQNDGELDLVWLGENLSGLDVPREALVGSDSLLDEEKLGHLLKGFDLFDA